jgi:hypothetical protein
MGRSGSGGRRVGPLVGGWLVDTIARMIFINLPVAAAAASAWAYVAESKDRRRSPSLDWAGADARRWRWACSLGH